MAAPAAAWRSPDLPIRVGISACLLGEAVRYDGAHQKDHYITGVLAQHFSWVSVCPELEVGMGVPREPVRLVGSPEAPRMLGVTSGTDHTGRMNAFARRRVQDLAREKLSGYILKRASPSCGMERVKVYPDGGAPARAGAGLFARALMKALPLLPVEEEGRLDDARLRDNFITRVFAYRRLAALRDSEPRPAISSPSTPRTSTCCSRTARPRTRAWAARWPRSPATLGRPGSTATVTPSCAG
jgi:uncharacterized protein YbbK (DUF523 family)